MERIEKTVFISYRRTNVAWARSIFQYLRQEGYDVFFDYDGIASGDFERVIFEQIRARAHFLVLLTPSAFDRCTDPTDLFYREIESAISTKRNIVPITLEGFDFQTPEIAIQLSGVLTALSRYNALAVPDAFFDEAMDRLCSRYLSVALNAVLHPVSLFAQLVAKKQQDAANAAPVSLPKREAPAIQKSMEERLADCRNPVAVEFFKQRGNVPTNSHKNALTYRYPQADKKIHWYVQPTPAGARVLQIDRFKDDEATWGKGLSNPNITAQTYADKANLRFDLTSLPDFEFF